MKRKLVPKHLAMLICDYVIIDAETHNKSLVGIFNRLHAVQFPVRHDRLHVFVALTNGHGEYNAELRLRNSDGKEIMKLGGRVNMPEPLGVAEMNFNIRGLSIPEAGRYFFEFWCDGEMLVDRSFDAVKIDPPKNAPPESPGQTPDEGFEL